MNLHQENSNQDITDTVEEIHPSDQMLYQELASPFLDIQEFFQYSVVRQKLLPLLEDDMTKKIYFQQTIFECSKAAIIENLILPSNQVMAYLSGKENFDLLTNYERYPLKDESIDSEPGSMEYHSNLLKFQELYSYYSNSFSEQYNKWIAEFYNCLPSGNESPWAGNSSVSELTPPLRQKYYLFSCLLALCEQEEFLPVPAICQLFGSEYPNPKIEKDLTILEQYWRLESNVLVFLEPGDPLSQLILFFCLGEKYISSKEIHDLMGNEPKNNLIRESINKLVNDGLLERRYPHRNDSRQGYRTVKSYRTIQMPNHAEHHLCWISCLNSIVE